MNEDREERGSEDQMSGIRAIFYISVMTLVMFISLGCLFVILLGVDSLFASGDPRFLLSDLGVLAFLVFVLWVASGHGAWRFFRAPCLYWSAFLRRLVASIPSHVRMRLALVLGLVSLALGIGIWWPMVAAGEFRDTADRIPSYYRASLLANWIGLGLLRAWFVQRRECRRKASGAGEPAPEPRVTCEVCETGQLIRMPVAVMSWLSIVGYVILAWGLWHSADVAERCFRPGGTGSIFIDSRNWDLLVLAVVLLLGGLLSLRRVILVCDHCGHLGAPGPRRPGIESRSPEDESVEDLNIWSWPVVTCGPEDPDDAEEGGIASSEN